MKLSNYLSSLVSGGTWKSFFHAGIEGLLEMKLATVCLWPKKKKKIVPSPPGLSFKENCQCLLKRTTPFFTMEMRFFFFQGFQADEGEPWYIVSEKVSSLVPEE